MTPSSNRPAAALKSVSFLYSASKELSGLFEAFRNMCSDALRIAVQRNPKNRLALIEAAYGQLKEYHLHSHYVLSACEVAFSVYRNKKRKSLPRFRSNFIKLDNESYQLNHLLLRIPTTPRNFVFLTLRGSDYHQSFIGNTSLRRGSVTITTSSVVIAFSKGVESLVPRGFIGIDINERNATASATDGWCARFGELGDVAEIKERYKIIRGRISQATGKDRRITRELLAKYGRREVDRTKSRLHEVTTRIVEHARENGLGIKMEKLTGITRLYRKGNKLSASFRGRMNSWVFGETQRQIEYKSKWEGVPIWYVNPRGTSSNCLCGSRVARLEDRKLYCPKCDRVWDRDDLASKNIMACAVPQARPSKRSDEEGRRCGGPETLSRWREGKCRS
jgi:putative transposase